MELTPDQWSGVEELFSQALDREGEARQRWLEQRRARVDPQVYAEVVSLLAVAQTEGELSQVFLVSREAPPPDAGLAGERFGPWRLLELLGRGGMGEVYLAERADGAYQQRVALKLLKRGVDTDAVLRRFLRERRILGSLNHPNVARLLDAGAGPDGRPYLVMELVQGQPLTEWCRQHGTDVRGMLELMIGACEAVHAAHRQQVVHRDLKPSNVLVGVDGAAKLLDFGIAKLTGEDDGDTRLTALGSSPVTPQYAAPEQLLGLPATPASDVYSLGIMLYEMLTGNLPAGRRNAVMAAAVAGAARDILRPSVAVARARQGQWAEETRRRGRQRALAGDLDQILLKALDPDPARRYAGAAELADDLRRHLDGRPVLARPDGWLYVARKFVARNRLPVSAAAAVALAMIAGTSIALRQAHVARARADELRQVVDFQGAMLKRVSVAQLGGAWLDRTRARIAATLQQDQPLPPEQATAALAGFDQLRQWAQPSEVARETLADYLLDPERAEIAQRFGAAPLTEARLRVSLGTAYDDLGDFADAIAELRRAVELQTAALGADHPDALDSRLRLASTLGESGDTSAAPAAQAVYEARRRLLGPSHRDTLAAEKTWAELLARHGDNEPARALLEPLLAQQQQRFGREDPDSLATQLLLAGMLSDQGRFQDALRNAQEVLSVRSRVLGEENPQTLRAMDEVQFCLHGMGRNEEVRAIAEKELAIRRRVLGDDHPDTLKTLANLALVVQSLGDLPAAARLLKQAYLGDLRVLGADHPLSMSSAINYAISLRDRGNYDAALAIFRHVVAVRTHVGGAEHPRTLNALFQVAYTLGEKKDYAAGLPLLRQVLDTERRVIGPDSPVTLDAWSSYAEILYDSGDDKAALAELGPLFEAMQRVLGVDNERTLIVRRYIALSRRDLGDTETARGLLQRLLDDDRRALGVQHPETLEAMAGMAATLHRLHRDGEAQALAVAVAEGWRKQTGADSQDTADAERALAGYDEALGHREEAAGLRQHADAAEARLRAQWAQADLPPG